MVGQLSGALPQMLHYNCSNIRLYGKGGSARKHSLLLCSGSSSLFFLKDIAFKEKHAGPYIGLMIT